LTNEKFVVLCWLRLVWLETSASNLYTITVSVNKQEIFLKMLDKLKHSYIILA